MSLFCPALLVRMSVAQTETALACSPGTVAQVGPGLYTGWYEPGVATENCQAAADCGGGHGRRLKLPRQVWSTATATWAMHRRWSLRRW
jgi:hypothetical protein